MGPEQLEFSILDRVHARLYEMFCEFNTLCGRKYIEYKENWEINLFISEFIIYPYDL